jgi:CBS domain-containing protein
MLTARDIMTADPAYVRGSESVLYAAVRMADLGIGALPICGEDNRLHGMITDRDIVVKVLAAGKDPRAVHTSELAQGEVVTIGADDGIHDLLNTMARHKLRRLPVIDGDALIGTVALADVARALEEPETGLLLQAISEA